MARIQTARTRGVRAKLVYHFTRRALVNCQAANPSDCSNRSRCSHTRPRC
jgi:hypothetical protein